MTGPAPFTLEPCTPWLTGADLADCCTIPDTDLALADQAAEQATSLLFPLSGNRFTGLCERTVRPCPRGCRCWPARPGLWNGLLADRGWAWGGFPSALSILGRGAFTGTCPPLSTVKLSGYPVREILEVTIDGQTIDPAEYKILRYQDLVRLDKDGRRQHWPGCQNFGVEEGEGTFFVTYLAGVEPPPSAVAAAAQLACQLLRACPDDGETGDCDLPPGTVRVTRQGITIEAQTLGLYLASGQTGLAQVDAFIAVWGRIPRRPSVVMSPDVRPFAQDA